MAERLQADRKVQGHLQLRVGAQVMCVANLNEHLVNGSRGVVVGFVPAQDELDRLQQLLLHLREQLRLQLEHPGAAAAGDAAAGLAAAGPTAAAAAPAEGMDVAIAAGPGSGCSAEVAPSGPSHDLLPQVKQELQQGPQIKQEQGPMKQELPEIKQEQQGPGQQQVREPQAAAAGADASARAHSGHGTGPGGTPRGAHLSREAGAVVIVGAAAGADSRATWVNEAEQLSPSVSPPLKRPRVGGPAAAAGASWAASPLVPAWGLAALPAAAGAAAAAGESPARLAAAQPAAATSAAAAKPRPPSLGRLSLGERSTTLPSHHSPQQRQQQPQRPGAHGSSGCRHSGFVRASQLSLGPDGQPVVEGAGPGPGPWSARSPGAVVAPVVVPAWDGRSESWDLSAYPLTEQIWWVWPAGAPLTSLPACPRPFSSRLPA